MPIMVYFLVNLTFVSKGVHDQGENIADNGGAKVLVKKFNKLLPVNIGLQAAYRAYKKLPASEKECVPGFNLTSDQLFWVTT